MKENGREKIATFKERWKEFAGGIDYLKIALIIVPLLTLAISNVLILDLLKVNDRLTGITFFSFILSGLISAFNATKLKKHSRDGSLGTALSVLLTLAFMVTLSVQLANCIGKQGNLRSVFDLKTLFIYGILTVLYLIFIIGLIMRYAQANHVRK